MRKSILSLFPPYHNIIGPCLHVVRAQLPQLNSLRLSRACYSYGEFARSFFRFNMEWLWQGMARKSSFLIVMIIIIVIIICISATYTI